ncbi:hypothetical protein MP638_001492 [Amoeboaphelidium occidentale]|nr:hypothetical protein MP638_001492 [Amoeboaphelidium occidentale]
MLKSTLNRIPRAWCTKEVLLPDKITFAQASTLKPNNILFEYDNSRRTIKISGKNYKEVQGTAERLKQFFTAERVRVNLNLLCSAEVAIWEFERYTATSNKNFPSTPYVLKRGDFGESVSPVGSDESSDARCFFGINELQDTVNLLLNANNGGSYRIDIGKQLFFLADISQQVSLRDLDRIKTQNNFRTLFLLNESGSMKDSLWSKLSDDADLNYGTYYRVRAYSMQENRFYDLEYSVLQSETGKQISFKSAKHAFQKTDKLTIISKSSHQTDFRVNATSVHEQPSMSSELNDIIQAIQKKLNTGAEFTKNDLYYVDQHDLILDTFLTVQGMEVHFLMFGSAIREVYATTSGDNLSNALNYLLSL